jgi:large subunit ribosomal protein L21
VRKTAIRECGFRSRKIPKSDRFIAAAVLVIISTAAFNRYHAAALRAASPLRPSEISMTYAIIKVAGKQYRVREGERLLVDRLAQDEGATISPTVLLVGGDGAPVLDPGDAKVTATVLGAVKGPKIRIGKYKKRTGYRKHTGFSASLTQIQIESIGGKPAKAETQGRAAAKAPTETPRTETPPRFPADMQT